MIQFSAVSHGHTHALIHGHGHCHFNTGFHALVKPVMKKSTSYIYRPLRHQDSIDQIYYNVIYLQRYSKKGIKTGKESLVSEKNMTIGFRLMLCPFHLIVPARSIWTAFGLAATRENFKKMLFFETLAPIGGQTVASILVSSQKPSASEMVLLCLHHQAKKLALYLNRLDY